MLFIYHPINIIYYTLFSPSINNNNFCLMAVCLYIYLYSFCKYTETNTYTRISNNYLSFSFKSIFGYWFFRTHKKLLLHTCTQKYEFSVSEKKL